jgi:hypothetical protein
MEDSKRIKAIEELKKMNLSNPMRAFKFQTLDLERLQMHKILTEKKLLETFTNKTKHIKEDESILDSLETSEKYNQELIKVFAELIQ